MGFWNVLFGKNKSSDNAFNFGKKNSGGAWTNWFGKGKNKGKDY